MIDFVLRVFRPSHHEAHARRLERVREGRRGAHVRWHQKRGIHAPGCELCGQPARSSAMAGDSQAIEGPWPSHPRPSEAFQPRSTEAIGGYPTAAYRESERSSEPLSLELPAAMPPGLHAAIDRPDVRALVTAWRWKRVTPRMLALLDHMAIRAGGGDIGAGRRWIAAVVRDTRSRHRQTTRYLLEAFRELDPATPHEETEPMEETTDPLFDDFWALYPRKVGKGQARRAWNGALRKIEASAIVAAARRFAADPNLPSDKAFIPHPATWLNGERWGDEPLPTRKGHAPAGRSSRTVPALTDYDALMVSDEPVREEVHG